MPLNMSLPDRAKTGMSSIFMLCLSDVFNETIAWWYNKIQGVCKACLYARTLSFQSSIPHSSRPALIILVKSCFFHQKCDLTTSKDLIGFDVVAQLADRCTFSTFHDCHASNRSNMMPRETVLGGGNDDSEAAWVGVWPYMGINNRQPTPCRWQMCES